MVKIFNYGSTVNLFSEEPDLPFTVTMILSVIVSVKTTVSILVFEALITIVSVLPIFTDCPEPSKLKPSIVITVPTGPEIGLKLVMIGVVLISETKGAGLSPLLQANMANIKQKKINLFKTSIFRINTR